MNDLDRRIDTASRGAVRQRNYRRIRDRALVRLRKKYPDDYALLFEQERQRDEAEGKTWLDISGRTKRTMGSSRAPSRKRKVSLRHTHRNRKSKGKLGRKK
jgi:hypothetical protein